MSAFPEELPSWVQISLDAANRDKESWKEIARNERIRRDRAEARVKELEACVSQINEIQDDIRKALYQAWEEGYLFCATGKISLIGSSNPYSKNAGCPPPKFDNKDEESILAAALRCGIRHNEQDEERAALYKKYSTGELSYEEYRDSILALGVPTNTEIPF